MSSYASVKRRVLEVRKRTKRRHNHDNSTSSGGEKRARMHRSEGAIGRGSHTETYKVIHPKSILRRVNHEMILVENANPETKIEALLSYLDKFNAETSRRRSDGGGRSRRRKSSVVIFVRSSPTAKILESRLGPPVSNRSAKQKRHSRHSWKPKGQGRVGGRSEGPKGGDARATAYRTKGVGILHPRSSEVEEKAVCRDLRSGKLRCVVVAESGKLGCGDPLWDNRKFIEMVVVYDLPQNFEDTVSEYAAMSTYANYGAYGEAKKGTMGGVSSHKCATETDTESSCEDARPRIVTFACLANRSERRSARTLWTALSEPCEAGNDEEAVGSRRLPSRDEMFVHKKDGESQVALKSGRSKPVVVAVTEMTNKEEKSDRTSEGLKAKLRTFYARHNPEKLADTETFERLLESVVKRCGTDLTKERALFRRLNEKYAPGKAASDASS